MKRKRIALSYDDVLLRPQYSDINSRSDIDISGDLGTQLTLSLPIISSPMDTVTESDMANAMTHNGASAVIHRYNTIDEQVALVSNVFEPHTVGAAIGVTGDFIERASELFKAGVGYLCIDVAHGHHSMMRTALGEVRKIVDDEFHIMAGNVATLEGINDLSDWGANSVRCNIGGGSICSTRIQTGHGMPGLQTIIECSATDREVSIIADGGIKNSGDIVKALAAGADAVMVGSLLSGTDETPGEVLRDNSGERWKTYRGMASKEAQINWRGKYSSFEGVTSRVPARGPVEPFLRDLEQGIRSGFSYSGARNLTELQAKAEFVMQTSAGQVESRAHIKVRDF